MANTQVPPNYVVVFNIWAYDDQPTYRGGTGTLAISDTAHAYVAATSTAGQYMLVTKPSAIPGAGTFVSVNVTAAGFALNGNALPDLVQTFDLLGPVIPPATHFVVGNPTVRDKVGLTPPVDPGSATIPL
jgi:hypothetical protein